MPSSADRVYGRENTSDELLTIKCVLKQHFGMRFVYNKSYRINEWPTVNYNVTDLAPGSEKIEGLFLVLTSSFTLRSR